MERAASCYRIAPAKTTWAAPETTDVRSRFGRAKRASEFLCTLHGQQYGFEPVLARLFAFAGSHLPLKFRLAIGNVVRDA